MIAASQSDIGSFVRAAAYELEMGYKDLKSDVNRQLSWDGTGTLALVNANTTASTTLVIKGRESTEPALKFVDVDLEFDVVRSSAVIASRITVLAVSGAPNDSTATLTLSQSVTLQAGDALVRSGSFGNEIQGLLTALTDGTSTIYGVDRSLYGSYRPNEIDCNGSQLSLDLMQRAYNEALRRGNGSIQAVYCDFDSMRYYSKLLIADKRYVNTQTGDGSFGNKKEFNMDFMGVPLISDKDAPTRLMFLAPDVLKNYVLKEMAFADEQGTMYIAQTSQDAYEVRIRYFTNLFNEQPSACALLKDYISP